MLPADAVPTLPRPCSYNFSLQLRQKVLQPRQIEAPARLDPGLQFLQFPDIAAADRSLRRQPIPHGTAVLARSETAVNGIEKIRQQSGAGGWRRPRRGKKNTAACDKSRHIRALPAREMASESLDAENEHEPQQRQPPERAVQTRVFIECIGVVVIDGSLMGVVKNHCPARLERPSNDIRQ